MEVLIFLICVGLVVMLAPYILGALVLGAGIIGLFVTAIVVFTHELWKDRRR